MSPDQKVEQISWQQLGLKSAISSLAADPQDGGLWLGLSIVGIAHLVDGHVRAPYSAADGLNNGRVEKLRFDRDEVRLSVEGTPRTLRPLLRDEVYRIASEALRNAFRHAEASRVEVQLGYDDRSFELRVRDDGKGIGPLVLSDEALPGHFGVRGMRERPQKIGGKFSI